MVEVVEREVAFLLRRLADGDGRGLGIFNACVRNRNAGWSGIKKSLLVLFMILALPSCDGGQGSRENLG